MRRTSSWASDSIPVDRVSAVFQSCLTVRSRAEIVVEPKSCEGVNYCLQEVSEVLVASAVSYYCGKLDCWCCRIAEGNLSLSSSEMPSSFPGVGMLSCTMTRCFQYPLIRDFTSPETSRCGWIVFSEWDVLAFSSVTLKSPIHFNHSSGFQYNINGLTNENYSMKDWIFLLVAKVRLCWSLRLGHVVRCNESR